MPSAAQVARELLRLRRQLLLLYAVVIVGSLFTLEHVLAGVSPHRTRFLLEWLGVFVASLVAVALGRRIRPRMTILLARL